MRSRGEEEEEQEEEGGGGEAEGLYARPFDTSKATHTTREPPDY
jgi:hypothetical protein